MRRREGKVELDYRRRAPVRQYALKWVENILQIFFPIRLIFIPSFEDILGLWRILMLFFIQPRGRLLSEANQFGSG